MRKPIADLTTIVTELELARRWRKSLRSLQRWRAAGAVPRHLRIGNSIYYRKADIEAFEATHEVRPSAAAKDSRDDG